MWSFIFVCSMIIDRYFISNFIVGRRGHRTGRGHCMGRFHPSCIRLVYFLRKSTEFHVKRTECQIILFHFLLVIFLIIHAITSLLPPSADFSSSGRTPPTLPIAPPALLLFSFQLVYSLSSRVIYTGRRGVG